MRVQVYQTGAMPSVREIIESGRLTSNDPTNGAKLARFADLMRAAHRNPVRRNRRIGTVGSMTGISPGATNSQLSLAWSALGAANPTAAIINGPNLTLPTTTRSKVTYTFGNTLATDINQIAQTTVTVTQGTPLSFAMTPWAAKNIFNDASATFTAVKEWLVELLTVAQGGNGGNPAGGDPSSITVGAAASNAWAGVLNSTGTITIGKGGCWWAHDETAAGIEVTAADVLKIVNNDSTNTLANIRITALGLK